MIDETIWRRETRREDRRRSVNNVNSEESNDVVAHLSRSLRPLRIKLKQTEFLSDLCASISEDLFDEIEMKKFLVFLCRKRTSIELGAFFYFNGWISSEKINKRRKTRQAARYFVYRDAIRFVFLIDRSERNLSMRFYLAFLFFFLVKKCTSSASTFLDVD